jgi:hypothetical protein
MKIEKILKFNCPEYNIEGNIDALIYLYSLKYLQFHSFYKYMK